MEIKGGGGGQKEKRNYFLFYRPSLQDGSDQLFVTLYISIYPSVHKQLIRTISEGRAVSDKKI